MTRSSLDDAFGRHVWATLQVIDACESLPSEQLATTVPGTCGSIIETLRHLVGGDAGYLSVLTEGRIAPIDEDGMDLEDLREVMQAHAEAWASVLSADRDPETVVVRRRDDGSEVQAPLGGVSQNRFCPEHGGGGAVCPPGGSVAQSVPVSAWRWRGCLSPHRPGGQRSPCERRGDSRHQIPKRPDTDCRNPHGLLGQACSPKGEQAITRTSLSNGIQLIRDCATRPHRGDSVRPANTEGIRETWDARRDSHGLLARACSPGEQTGAQPRTESVRSEIVLYRLAQAVHPGTDHRSQICTAVTTLGVTPPEIDVWAHAFIDGRLRGVPPA